MRIAALTMVRDERVMLPRWMAHYAVQCGGSDHLYVIDDNTTDGSTTGLPCSVIRVPDWGEAHFERTRMGLVSGIAAGLLAVYDAIVFADADEFLVADPARFDDLADLLAHRQGQDVLGAMTLNVVHDLAREPALDAGRPVLDQRSWAKFVPLMCKPALKRVPAPWVAASHGITVPFAIDPALYLFHLKFADRDHLRTVGDHRKQLADSQGRADATSWKFDGNDLVRLVEEVTAGIDPADVPEFTPPRQRLKKLVQQSESGGYRAHGRRQVPAMREQPMVRVPDRFRGLV